MVYVDEVKHYPKCKWRYKYWSHMWADTVEELHEMAIKIGHKREWFQNDKRLPHYDVTPSRRNLAIKHGAVEKSLYDYFKEQRRLVNGRNRSRK